MNLKGGLTCNCEMQLPEQDSYQQCRWDMVAACAKYQERHSQAAVAAQQPGTAGAAGRQLSHRPRGSTQLLQQLAGGCCGAPPSLHSRKQLAGLLEPVAMPEAHSNSAELASGPSGTMVTLNPLGGLCLFWWHGVLPGPPTSGIGSKQVSHSPETVVGIQGPFLSLASQHRALQSMWG